MSTEKIFPLITWKKNLLTCSATKRDCLFLVGLNQICAPCLHIASEETNILLDKLHTLTDSKPEVAESFSNLLIVGFYLINLGFESLALKYGGAATDTVSAIELLSTKIGFVLLCLGAMHFITVAVLTKSRRTAVTPPPTAPAYLR